MVPPAPGFDTSRVSPRDAVATLRSLRRRFAEAFDRANIPDDLMRRPSEGGLTPMEHAAWTASALEAIGSALTRVLLSPKPSIELPPVDPSEAVARGLDPPPAVLSVLGDTARNLGDAIAQVHGDEWARIGLAPEGEVSALDIARLAVQIAVEHLRAAEATIAGAPG